MGADKGQKIEDEIYQGYLKRRICFVARLALSSLGNGPSV